MPEYDSFLKRLFLFHEDENKMDFVLPETNSIDFDENDKDENNKDENNKDINKNDLKENKENTNESNSKDFNESETTKSKSKGLLGFLFNKSNHNVRTEDKKLDKAIDENLKYIKEIFCVPLNSDVMIREFELTLKNHSVKAFIVFIDGMTDRKVIDDNILTPLMILSKLEINEGAEVVFENVKKHLLPHNQIKLADKHSIIVEEVCFGGCGLYIDGSDQAIAMDVKGWEHRAVERPNTEIVLRGPQEAFNEIIRVNSALIRKRVKDHHLIVEGLTIGKKSKTPCSVLYINNIANDNLVKEVKRRLESIHIDYIFDSGELEQFIEDKSMLAFPQVIGTERPDKVASMLSEGRVAIILSGSPFVLVVPITYSDLIHSPEDQYIRFPFGNLLRLIRMIGLAVSLLLPGLYIAITNYHQEMVPTDLLIAIEAAREKVPFPSVVEILIMEVAFELIREAGVRVPGPVGPTLGIIGALILGQAAVAANIVSPILIIIVAVTGIGSFAVPNFSLGFSFRILRFVYIFLGALAGLLGITVGIFVNLLILVHSKSFGVPFLSPYAPQAKGGSFVNLFRSPIWKQEMRPDILNTKEKRQQENYSRGWKKK